MVALKHTIWKEGTRTVHFYDGSLEATDGVVDVPSDKPAWVQRAWILGYRLDPETGENIPHADLLARIVDESAESADEEKADEPAKKKSSRRRRRTTS